MKISIKKGELWVYTLVALNSELGLILPVSLNSWRMVITILSFVFLIWSNLSTRGKKYEISKYIYIYLLIFMVIVGYEVLRGKSLYNYSLYEAFYSIRYFLWIIITIPLTKILIELNNLERFLEIISKIVVISLVLKMVIWVFYNFFGLLVSRNIMFPTGLESIRNGISRVSIVPLAGIILVSSCYLYTISMQKKYLFRIVFIIGYSFIIAQTRMNTICCICSVMVYFFLYNRRSLSIFIIRCVALLAIFISVIMGVFDEIIEKVGLSGGIFGDGMGYRKWELSYYLSLLQHGKWKTGLGILSAINPNSDKILYGNLNTRMYLDDVGYLELFVQVGLLSVLIYGLYIFIYIVSIKKCDSLESKLYIPFLVGILTYILTSSFSMNAFGNDRFFCVPMMLAICGYIIYENENSINNLYR